MGVIEEASYDFIKNSWAADGWPAEMARKQAKAVSRLLAGWFAQIEYPVCTGCDKRFKGEMLRVAVKRGV